jgi:hypothetical protein
MFRAVLPVLRRYFGKDHLDAVVLALDLHLSGAESDFRRPVVIGPPYPKEVATHLRLFSRLIVGQMAPQVWVSAVVGWVYVSVADVVLVSVSADAEVAVVSVSVSAVFAVSLLADAVVVVVAVV